MKKLTTGKIWQFAVGQFGWALLSGLIANWLVYFYQPDLETTKAGLSLFIPQGTVILGIVTIIGAITAVGRLFDAVTDPWIASLSDRCKSKQGRRIPFLKFASIPLALSTFMVFMAPIGQVSWWNGVWLFVFVIAYYVSITAYCTPYTALIPEMGHTQEDRLKISTIISLTFIIGTAVAYMAPVIWGIFEPTFGLTTAMRIAFGILCSIALVCLLVPVFTIKEKDYVTSQPTQGNAFSSLIKTFKNKEFRIFVGSDILYWIALTMFQTGLPYFVNSLLGLEISYGTIFFVLMTVLSLVFYIPVNKMAKKFGKKKVVMIAFVVFTITYFYAAIMGENLPIDPVIQGVILSVIASFPMAIFGILPQAMVADVSESDAITTGENREGMFYAARTFAFKMGQSIAMLIFTSVATLAGGYRIAAAVACVFCILGGVVLFSFDENKVNSIIHTKK